MILYVHERCIKNVNTHVKYKSICGMLNNHDIIIGGVGCYCIRDSYFVAMITALKATWLPRGHRKR